MVGNEENDMGIASGLERLETRVLLSVSSSSLALEAEFSYLQQAPVTGPESVRPSISADGEASRYDAGDGYWYFDQRIALLRSPSDLVVSLPRGSGPSVLDALVADRGLLEGFTKTRTLSQQTIVVSRQSQHAIDIETALAVLEESELVAWSGPALVDPRTGEPLWATNEIIVAFAPHVDAQAFFGTGYEEYRQLFMNQYVATVGGSTSTVAIQLAGELNADPNVLWATPNFYRDFHVATDDPLYADQWHLDNTGQTGARPDADVDAPKAWSSTQGSQEIVIAILDNGVALSHPDLAANISQNEAEVNGSPGVDDDGNDYIDDFNGWDFTDGDNWLWCSQREQ
jgi:subtilisin family serine protease